MSLWAVDDRATEAMMLIIDFHNRDHPPPDMQTLRSEQCRVADRELEGSER
jgi:CHAT domain-containing protein